MTLSACRVCFQSHVKTCLRRETILTRHGFGDVLMFQAGALCVSHANKSLRFLYYDTWIQSLWDLMSHSEAPGIAGSTPWRFPFGDHSFWYVDSWSSMQPWKDRTEVGERQEDWSRGLMHIDSQHKSFIAIIAIIAAFWNILKISEALLFAQIWHGWLGPCSRALPSSTGTLSREGGWLATNFQASCERSYASHCFDTSVLNSIGECVKNSSCKV